MDKVELRGCLKTLRKVYFVILSVTKWSVSAKRTLRERAACSEGTQNPCFSLIFEMLSAKGARTRVHCAGAWLGMTFLTSQTSSYDIAVVFASIVLLIKLC